MILCDREIKAAIDNAHIIISPRPDLRHWTSTAIDLTLDKTVRRWIKQPEELPNGQPGGLVRPHTKQFDIKTLVYGSGYTETIEIGESGYRLDPLSFVLAFTEQLIYLPIRSRIAARVEGKSSLARLGVGIHVTAPTIHAGFGLKHAEVESDNGSPIQLEIYNIGPLRVVLDTGMPICQLIFEEVRETPDKGYIGKFSDQPKFNP